MAPPKKPSKTRSVPAAVRLEEAGRLSGDTDDPRRTDRILGRTLREAAEGFLTPERPQLLAAKEALTGDVSASEAWEALAARELIPIEWTHAGARQIHVDGMLCEECDERAPYVGHAFDCEQKDLPPTTRAAIAIASNAEAIAAVELLAIECFQRLMGSELAVPPIVWRVMTASKARPLTEQRPGRALRKSSKIPLWEVLKPWNTILERRGDYELPEGYRRGPNGTLLDANNQVVRMRWRTAGYSTLHADWISACTTDMHSHWNWILSARETRPNPFTPLVEAWLLGYCVEVINEESIVLFCPEPFEPID